MKKCSKCREAKGFDQFYANRRQPDNLDNYCKPCRRSVRRYDKPYKERKSINRNRKFVQDAKKPCVVCGESEPCVIDFHHKNPEEKSFVLAQAGNRSFESVKAELDKCVCLCANCHRKLHAGIITLD